MHTASTKVSFIHTTRLRGLRDRARFRRCSLLTQWRWERYLRTLDDDELACIGDGY